MFNFPNEVVHSDCVLCVVRNYCAPLKRVHCGVQQSSVEPTAILSSHFRCTNSCNVCLIALFAPTVPQ